jgi:PAS domain S-box-containing protein
VQETIPQLKSRITRSVGAILTAVICISAWSMYAQYRDAVNIAEKQAEGYVRVLAEHSESALAEADRILLDTLHELKSEGGVGAFDRRAQFDLLRRESGGASQIGSLFIADKDGTMVANSNTFPQPPINIADRAYFRHYLNNPGADLTISRPVLSRLVNRWRFNLIRPLPHTGDSFNGILAVAFEVVYFKNFLGPISLGPQGRVLLLRDDGAPLVYEPYVEKAYEIDFRKTVLFSKMLPASPSGTFQITHSTIDGESRIISYQRLKRFPVIAVIALHKGDILNIWGSRAVFQSLLTLGLCLVIVYLTKFLFRHLDTLHSTRSIVDEQEEELRIKATLIDAASDAILQVDDQGVLINFNQALCTMTGYNREELYGKRLHEIEPPEFAARILPNVQVLQQKGHATFESAYVAKDGTVVPTEIHARTLEIDGHPMFLSIVRDISQRKRAEIRDETRLRILEGMATGSSLPDLLELIVRFVEQENPGALCSVLLADESGTHLKHGAAPSLPDFYNKAVDGLRIGQGMGSCGTAAYTRSRVIVEEIDGHPFWKGFKPAREAGLHACWSEPVLSSNSDLLGTFAMYYREPRAPKDDEVQFIESAAFLASIAIGRVREEELRKKLEEQLRHIQKIEAIGQLAGGIAHDFNNLLTPILVYADMVKRGLPEEHPQLRRVEGIITAAHKAKDLTQKLLSFGRKQMLCMEVLDLNEVIDSFRDIMRRTIRENITIDVKLAPGGAKVQADRSQLEQILLNLTVNAQDAIEGVGTISVATGHVLLDDEYIRQHHGMLPGPYILLAFKDNGCGMDDSTLRHIYEPFFTTKAVGHGTGLGLATVYGIIKQHEGYIETRSHVGEGTAFLIYLPATTEKTEKVDVEPPQPLNMPSASATILLVEDNSMVREMACDLLESDGFTVLVADSPRKAREIEQSFTGTIDLLLTDVVMPEMNGIDLYESLRDRRPAMPVLYISGYTSDVVVHDGILVEEVNFLKKPFTVEQFKERVKQVMGLT